MFDDGVAKTQGKEKSGKGRVVDRPSPFCDPRGEHEGGGESIATEKAEENNTNPLANEVRGCGVVVPNDSAQEDQTGNAGIDHTEAVDEGIRRRLI